MSCGSIIVATVIIKNQLIISPRKCKKEKKEKVSI